MVDTDANPDDPPSTSILSDEFDAATFENEFKALLSTPQPRAEILHLLHEQPQGVQDETAFFTPQGRTGSREGGTVVRKIGEIWSC
jgi:hypothetical protein